MEIISRQEAIRLGRNKYFTGRPCKNGHVAERYVQGCICRDCISPVATPLNEDQRTERQRIVALKLAIEQERLKLSSERARINAQRLNLTQQRQARRDKATEVKSGLIKIRLTCLFRDIEAVRQFAYLLAAAREPAVTYLNIACPHLVPAVVGGGLERYTLACFPEDREQIVEYMVGLQNITVEPVQPAPIPYLTMQERINSQLRAADPDDGICKHGKYFDEHCEKCATAAVK